MQGGWLASYRSHLVACYFPLPGPTLPSVPSPAKIGKQHPDRVVETSTLSSVPPPDITYTLALPISDKGTLSALQLEAITYACQVAGPALPRPTMLMRRAPGIPDLTNFCSLTATRGSVAQWAACWLPNW